MNWSAVVGPAVVAAIIAGLVSVITNNANSQHDKTTWNRDKKYESYTDLLEKIENLLNFIGFAISHQRLDETKYRELTANIKSPTIRLVAPKTVRSVANATRTEVRNYGRYVASLTLESATVEEVAETAELYEKAIAANERLAQAMRDDLGFSKYNKE
ncbi:UNVERIFIED_CONTAM: hypothetical protein RF653_15215 [Kocuria sp. CPCC 205316]|uniref:hypothetical protein n=1 Tax=Kocuria TaxID=57493 RepID=UPI0036DEDAD0